MKRSFALVFALSAVLLVPLAARAALDIGEAAPPFTTQAAQGGKIYKFSLAEALAKGPVVVYFFPAAFSAGCSIEAHTFAESIDKFAALKTTVIGVSGDNIDTLAKFSVQECQNKFPVGSDDSKKIMTSFDASDLKFPVGSDDSKKIMTSFDAVMTLMPEYANRISYLIAPDGKIIYQYKSLNPYSHVTKVLSALQDWSKSQTTK
jgi:peroxiredoxin